MRMYGGESILLLGRDAGLRRSDDFKGINDNHGHQVGDALARIGGDEFAIIAPGVHAEAVHNLARSVCDAVGTQYSDATTPSPSASVGWAVFPQDGHDVESLIHAADERMLRSKRPAESVAI